MSTRTESSLARWFHSSGWWLAERLTALLAAIAVQVVVVRTLGPSAYGEIAYALAVVALLLPIVQWGAAGIVAKAIASNPKDQTNILSAALLLRIAGSTIAVTLGCAYWWLTIDNAAERAPLMVLMISQFALCLQVVEQHYQVTAEAKPIASARMIITGVAALAKATAALWLESPAAVLLIYACENLLQGIVHTALFRRALGVWPIPNVRSPWIPWLAARSPWLILSGLAEAVYLKIDLIMLERLGEPHDLGSYAAAARISEAWLILPSVLVASGFMRLWEHRNPPELWRRELQRWLDLLAGLALTVALAMTFFSDFIITTLFGPDMTSAAPILAIHVWGGVFAAMRALFSRWLLIQDLVRLSLFTTLSGALVNVLLNLWLIPAYGGRGAAVSTVLAYATAGLLSLFILPETRPIAWQMTKAICLPLRWSDLADHGRDIHARWSRRSKSP